MVSSNDIVLFYLGLELQSLSLYILASIDRDNLRSSESGIKYFVLSALSSGLLLYGCSLLYGFTGSTNFDLIANELNKENIGAVFAMVFILVGFISSVYLICFMTPRAGSFYRSVQLVGQGSSSHMSAGVDLIISVMLYFP